VTGGNSVDLPKGPKIQAMCNFCQFSLKGVKTSHKEVAKLSLYNFENAHLGLDLIVSQ